MRQAFPTLLAALIVLVPVGQAEELADGIAAQVGSDVVLLSDVERLVAPVEAEMRQVGVPDAEIVKVRAEALERLIERRLIGQLARRAEIEASDAEIDQAIAAIGSENGLSPEQVRASVEAQGLPFDAYRGQLAEQIVHQKVLGSMVQSRVRVDEAELRRLYRTRFGEQRNEGEEVHLRHLVIAPRGKGQAALDAACQEAQRARARMGDVGTFQQIGAELAGAGLATGGDLGWVHAADLAGWMAPAVAELSAGQVSQPIETPFGCNLLELVARRQANPVTYEAARSQLRAQIFEERFAEEYMRFVEKLRERTYVERKGIFAEAARLGEPRSGGAPPPPTP